jgi:uncharacterized protein
LLNADSDTAMAMRGMMTLVDIARSDQHGPLTERDALTTTAPDNIARWIVTLNAWRIANDRPPQGADPMPRQVFTPTNKIGRNDPCPCGSGKKYKRCCGLH